MTKDNLYDYDLKYNGLLPSVSAGKISFRYTEVTTVKEFKDNNFVRECLPNEVIGD